MSWRISLVLATAAIPLGCHEPASAPPFFEPGLPDRELWSGGEFRVTVPAFANTTAIVLLGSDTLTYRLADETTLVARLPRRAGAFPVRVVAGKLAASLGNVTLHGFQAAYFGPIMSGQPYWIPAGAPLVFAGSDVGAALVDLRTSTPVVSLPAALHSPDCIWSPSPSYRSDRFVLLGKAADGTCGVPKLWSITSSPQLLDSIACCSYTWYTSGQPSDRRWIFNWNNHNYFYNCDSVPCAQRYFASADGPSGVTISPRGDRFLWLPADQPVVFDSKTLDTAFVLPQFGGLYGAFSFEGDTLAVTAGDSANHVHVLAVRATDGTIVHDLEVDSVIPLPRYRGWSSVAFDPTRPWLYALIFRFGDSTWVPTLLVLDRSTWSPVGVLDVPEGKIPGMFAAFAIVPSPLEHGVYLVNAVNGYSMHSYHAVITRFSTP